MILGGSFLVLAIEALWSWPSGAGRRWTSSDGALSISKGLRRQPQYPFCVEASGLIGSVSLWSRSS